MGKQGLELEFLYSFVISQMFLRRDVQKLTEAR